ncbi:MAG: disulfide reductase [Candidatus Omnitrophota bacterium]|jgi:heterodisulfide reductase subunit B|nr:MAG: disulfide reductase [Candidatus Omnitrophota bacterium]
MRYIYYPGCSLKGTGRAYEESVLAVFRALELQFEELDDWNCCGATAYMAIDELQAFTLAARNLALAEKQFADEEEVNIIAPCSACYLVLMKAQHYIEEYTEIGDQIRSALKECHMEYEGRIRIRHPLDVFVNDIGLEKIKSLVRKPLDGLRVASYYGCQMVRPYKVFDHHYSPTTMDDLMRALGAKAVDWSLKTRCCGGSLTGTIEQVGMRLSFILLNEAQKRGANVIATSCPLCQFNLECYQGSMNRKFNGSVDLPAAYFTQLMGMAYGISNRELGLQRLFVPMTSQFSKKEGYQHVGV